MPEIIGYYTLDEAERRYEQDIETAFVSERGFERIHRSEYDAERALFPDVLIRFLKSTQPKEWGRYEKYYGPNSKDKLCRRINSAVEASGMLWVLKNGIEDMGIKLKLCYFKPDSTLNGDLSRLYAGNIFGVTRQFPYSTTNNNAIDMVLSINGIPLFAFELKNEFKGQNYEDAIRQWQTDRDPKEYCFKFDRRFLAYFAIDLNEAWVTTELKKGDTNFLPFNQGSEGAGNSGGAGNPANPAGYPTDYIWNRVFTKDSMSDLVQRFIVRVSETQIQVKDGVEKKTTIDRILFPRFHQYDVVHKVLEDVKDNGSGKNYLIDHSAGSGKSNSIAWVAYRLASAFDANDVPIFSSVIVVTNRIVLDSQLQDTINSFDHRAGLLECITQKKGSRGLVQAVNDKRKIIICTVQKFLYAYKDFVNINDRNFAIIVDEAHQGQSGESARTLRKSLTDMDKEWAKYKAEQGVDEETELDDLYEEILAQGQHKNQSFFAFTATPIPKTISLFGTKGSDGKRHPFHIYSMRQAIEEGFILDVLQDYHTVKQAFRLVKDSEENPILVEGKAKKALLEYAGLHEFTVGQKVEMIMATFLANGRRKIGGKGKAMVVAGSRKQALSYYYAIKKYIDEHPNECVGCGVLVAFSGALMDPDDPTKTITEVDINRDYDGRAITTDKKLRAALHGDHFNILVVANKYQTGYDEPLLHSMYVDKQLKGVNAVQTLSRLNRVYKGKTDTFVLDFANTAETIKSSFQTFYQGVELNGDMDINTVYDLRSALSRLALYSTQQIEEFNKVMAENSGKKQSSTAIGRLVSILKPSVDAYRAIADESDAYKARDTMMKFVRCYGFVTQLVRIDDQELFKEYIFVEHLLHLLPKKPVDPVDLRGKIQLEYYKLQDTYSGSIELEKADTIFVPSKSAKPAARIRKTDTLERIVKKVNDEYGGDFGPGDKVVIENVFQMMMGDAVVKKRLKEYAKSNDAHMFISSIFPGEFQRILVECFKLNDDAFQRLLGDEAFQKSVMDAMAKEFYKTLAVADNKTEADGGN